jgi:hypothetical protein
MRTFVISLTLVGMTGMAGPASPQNTQSVVFDRQPLSGQAGDTVALHWVDLDGDGDSDLVSLRAGEPSVVYRNEHGSLLADDGASHALLDPGPLRGGAFGDLDGDGDPDAYLVLGPQASNRLLVNLGGAQGGAPGAFQELSLQPALGGAGQSTAVALGDLDGDAHLDVVLLNGDAPDLLAFGAGGFSFDVVDTGDLSQASGLSTAVALADLDLDGDLDVLVTRGLGASNDVFVNLGDGQLERLAGDPFSEPEGDSCGLSVGDLNLDGLPDVLVVNDGGVSFLFENVSAGGQPAFARVTSGPFDPDHGDTGTQPASSLGDMDDDGDVDVLVANNGLENFVYLSSGEAEFDYLVITEGQVPEDDSETEAATLGDPDGDGDLDLVVAGKGQLGDVLYENLGPLWKALHPGTPGQQGVPRLSGQGTLAAGMPLTVALRDAAPQATALLLVSAQALPQAFAGGVLVPALWGPLASAQASLQTDASGAADVSANYPAGLPTGAHLYFQALVLDATGSAGLVLSNALQATGQ